MAIYTEESFGPVVALVRVHGVDEAVRVANDTDYGLSSAVFGRDVGRAIAVAQRIESGICHVNGATVHDEAQMPFGGVKASGYGRLGGAAAIPRIHRTALDHRVQPTRKLFDLSGHRSRDPTLGGMNR